MNKEIEEMSKILCKECSKYKKNCIGGQCNIQCVMAEFCSEALYNAGYHKTEVKTNGDKIRSMSDEELARLCLSAYWGDYGDGVWHKSILTEKNHPTFKEAYNANLEYLKQEYKEK